jgi:streptogramin lyase
MNGLSSLLKRVRGSNTRRPRHRASLGLEPLEERCLPTTITELNPLPTPGAAPAGITRAADGSVWFAEQGANKLGRISPTGVLTEYAVPTPSAGPQQLTATPDGYVWFTERTGGKIGRVSDGGGAIAEFRLPGVGEMPTAICTRYDGTVWFASNESPNTARIGKVSSAGVITELPRAQTATYVTGLVSGPDGNLWITNVSATWGDSVAKVSTVGWGTYTYYHPSSPSAGPQSITVGPDNNLWFTEQNSNKIGRLTTTGLLTEFALAAGRGPQGITAGPDGALWFTEKTGNMIGRISTTGVVSEYAVPTAAGQPWGITLGPGGDLWFTEQGGNKIGKVVLS